MEYMEALRKIKCEMDSESSDGGQAIIHKMTNEERHRFMSNPEIKFAVVDDEIHDKQCDNLKGVSNDLLTFYEEYQRHIKQCSDCSVKAYIRAGAEDFGNCQKYMDFYNSHDISGKGIKGIYITNKCTTKFDAGILSLHNRQDTWKIVDLGRNKGVKLMHNSYTVNSKDERCFNGGFHVQVERTTLKNALDRIYSYDYSANPRKHIVNEADRLENKNRNRYKKLSVLRKMRVRIRRYLIKHYSLDGEIRLSDFRTVEEYGYPKENQICAYLWETDSGDRYWMIGSYSPQYKLFHTSFYGSRKNVKQENVVAWKPMYDDGFRI